MSSAQSTAQLIADANSLARRQALLDEAASILLGRFQKKCRATRFDLARARQLVEEAARIADEEAATLHRRRCEAQPGETLSTRAV